jgi:hypothetical protein
MIATACLFLALYLGIGLIVAGAVSGFVGLMRFDPRAIGPVGFAAICLLWPIVVISLSIRRGD